MRPSLPVVLVSDLGTEDGLLPGIAFDRVLSRLDGPAALLATLRELTSNVVSISVASTRSARETRSQARRLRAKLAEMRQEMRRMREMLSHKANK